MDRDFYQWELSELLVGVERHRKDNATSSLIGGLGRVAKLHLEYVLKGDEARGKEIEVLLETDFHAVLQEQIAVLDEAIELDPASKHKNYGGGNYDYLLLGHTADAIGDRDTADRLFDIAGRPEVVELSTRFWRVYGAALSSILVGTPLPDLSLKLKGIENYWSDYVELFVAIFEADDAINDVEVGRCIENVEERFVELNKNKRLSPSVTGLEGSGKEPIQFDIRLAGIMSRFSL